MATLMFRAGIENSARTEEMQSCRHQARGQEDFAPAQFAAARHPAINPGEQLMHTRPGGNVAIVTGASSDDAQFITGATLVVDGARQARP
jgi:hypothetical protein